MEIFIIKEFIFWFCVIAGVGAFLFLPMSLIHHYVRAQKTSQGFSAGLVKELFWLIIPCLMILFMVLPAGEEMVNKHMQGSVLLTEEFEMGLVEIFGEAHTMIVSFVEGLT